MHRGGKKKIVEKKRLGTEGKKKKHKKQLQNWTLKTS